MKSLFLFRSLPLPGLAFLGLSFGLIAQEPPPSAEKSAPPTPAAEAARAPDAAVAAPESPPAPAPETPAASEPTERRGGLRRIDAPDTNEPAPQSAVRRSRQRRSASDEVPFGNHVVPKGSVIDEAISILGTNNIDGEVRRDAVSVLGQTIIGPEAKVGGAAVAVLGMLQSQGDIGRNAVSVLGGVQLNGHVRGEAVCVLGDLHLGPQAVVDGNIVIVGGTVTKDPAAIVHGNEVHLPISDSFQNTDKLTTWLKRCLFLGRPLAFGHDLAWAWAVALSFLAVYVVLAALFGRGIERCLETFETRPGSSILAAVLTVLLSPIAMLLLIITIVGIILVPFLSAGLFFAGLFGKAVMLAWIGRRVAKLAGSRAVHPALAVLIGGVIVLALYTIWGSFILYKLLTWLGLGVVVYTISLSMKRETPAVAMAASGGGRPIGTRVSPVTPRPAAATPPSVVMQPPAVNPGFTAPPPATTESFAGAPKPDAPMMSPGFGTARVAPAGVTPPEGVAPPVFPATGAGAEIPRAVPPMAPPPVSGMVPPPVIPPPAAGPVVISPDTLPRAGFFLRLAAMLLDTLLIAMSLAFFTSMLPRILRFNWCPSGLLLALAIYGAVMWRQKGTTIGGIICGLKVVRLDEREIDWTTAIVRALSCFLSLFAAGLGFLWVAFDDGKQSWHDKIAGTTVVRVPKGVSLL